MKRGRTGNYSGKKTEFEHVQKYINLKLIKFEEKATGMISNERMERKVQKKCTLLKCLKWKCHLLGRGIEINTIETIEKYVIKKQKCNCVGKGQQYQE